jgi:hypothetical protein
MVVALDEVIEPAHVAADQQRRGQQPWLQARGAHRVSSIQSIAVGQGRLQVGEGKRESSARHERDKLLKCLSGRLLTDARQPGSFSRSKLTIWAAR